MTTPTLHTPFEALIFFQSLRVLGVETSTFAQISELLKTNEFIKQSESYDPGRLSPDSLRQFFLELLKEEVRNEASRRDKANPNTDDQGNPRKRKLSSPPIGSIDTVGEYVHLLPQLIDRLYARYRDQTIKAIEDEEKKYRLLQRDIHEIEQGEWDARLQHQEITSRREPREVTSIQTLLRHDSGEVPRLSKPSDPVGSVRPLATTSTTNPHEQSPHVDDATAAKTDEDDENKPEAPSNDSAARPSLSSVVRTDAPRLPPIVSHSRTSSAGTIPQVLSPHTDVPQACSRPSSQSRVAESPAPILPPPQPQTLGYGLASPPRAVPRRPSFPQSQGTSVPLASPRMVQAPLQVSERSPASPIILPPPPGMIRSSGSPPGLLDALADVAGHQHRVAPAQPSPRQPHFVSAQQSPLPFTQPRNFAQRPYPYFEGQSTYAVPHQSYGQHPMATYNSPSQVGLPPLQGSTPGNARFSPYQSPFPPYVPQPGNYPPSPAYPHTPQGFSPIQSQPAVPFSQRACFPTTSSRRRPPKPSPIDTSASSTKWKNVNKRGSNQSPGSPIPPQPGDVSPVSDSVASPVPDSKQQQLSKGRRGRPKQIKDAPQGAAISTPIGSTPKKSRAGRPRGSKTGARGARATSAGSSAITGSLRTSESIASPADELSSIANMAELTRTVKHEPPATPATIDGTSVASPITSEPSRKPGRGHPRESLRSPETSEPTKSSNKRKRSAREPVSAATSTHEPSVPPTSPAAPVARPNHVLASRNFPRTSATIMNHVSAHKLASMFAKPLTEREAPGYKDLIYRPQDLKSIKSAIVAGSRAIAATADSSGASGEAGSPTAAGSGGGTPSASNKSTTLWMPWSEGVVPPKGIVNSAQLERELCRVFANAVMFNPEQSRGLAVFGREEDNDEEGDGEEEGGVVRDAREMFAFVEKSVSEWRAAERVGEEAGVAGGGGGLRGRGGGEDDEEDDEIDELAGEASAVPSKRRKRG